jgi:hypothetical protein
LKEPLTGQQPFPRAAAGQSGGPNDPVGSFLANIRAWKEAGVSITILRWIRRRVPLPLWAIPRLRILPNHRLTDDQRLWVESEIVRLLNLQAIWILEGHKEMMSSPIRVVMKKNGKFRLIINMRFLNDYIKAPKFKYEGLLELAQILQAGDWHMSIDLKDGFFHVPV